MNILFIDIETSPNLAYVYGAFKQNIAPIQFKDHTYILSFAAKWLGNNEVIYSSNITGNDSYIVKEIISLLDKADIVVAHNAKKFDIPVILGRAAINGNMPPSPFKIIDTLSVCKRHFRLPRFNLEYLAEVFNCKNRKLDHGKFPGYKLWIECINKNAEAWIENKKYNIQDVLVLEELYHKIKPWDTCHPNLGVLAEKGETLCPKCGSEHINFRGYTTTNVGKYRKYVCLDCGGWGRTRYTEYDKNKRKVLGVNAING